jgi:Tfp pilus assembly protein PilF
MNRNSAFSAAVLLVFAAVGCGGGNTSGSGAKAPGQGGKKADNIVAEAKNKFDEALKAMVAHDKANDWNEAACTQTADEFKKAAEEQKNGAKEDKDKAFAEAIYNAGLSYQRCKKDADAKAQFAEALKLNDKFHRARVQLALYAFAESGEKNYDAAIAELDRSVKDAAFQNVEALVNLAMIQMRRNNQTADKDGANDFERAKRNIQRALAVDDGFMPAFNQLAQYYLETAKEKAGRDIKKRTATSAGKEKRVDTQALELAALVCSQAIRKNPNYAPIHNTAGMIQVELRNLNSAVSEFNTARKLDPTFYEAQMNFAAVNLQFRGFQQAEEAYRAALQMRPNDYDAHLGLALALRGQIDDSNFDKMVKGASDELDAAKKIAPDRPETYYNEAILTQEYKAKSGGKDAETALTAAKGLFSTFIQKAGSNQDYADAVKRSKDRMGEIDQIIEFNKQTEEERKRMEAEAKQREAEAEAKGGSDAAGGDKNDAAAPKP